MEPGPMVTGPMVTVPMEPGPMVKGPAGPRALAGNDGGGADVEVPGSGVRSAR